MSGVTAAAATYAQASSRRWGVPFPVTWGVLGMETDFGQNITDSSAGAKGIAQFLQSTAQSYSYPYVNSSSPAIIGQQINAECHYLHDLYAKSGSWDQALRAYSGGGYGYRQVIAKSNTLTFAQAIEGNKTGGNAGNGTGVLGLGVGPDVATNAPDVAAGVVTDTIGATAKLISALFDPSTYLRLGKGILGGVMVVAGTGAIVYIVANKSSHT